jgi:hypothetical protein
MMTKKGRQLHKKLKGLLYWNQYLRLILEASLELAIGAIYNIKIETEIYHTEGSSDRFWQPHLPFFWINIISTAGIFLILVLGPGWLLCFYLCKFKDWEKHKFESKMGSVLEGLDKTKKSIIFYPVFFMIRRTIIAWQAIFIKNAFTFQMITNITMSLIQLIYLLTVKPFENQLNQNLELLNESFTLLLTYLVLTLNEEWISNWYARHTVGYAFATIVALNILINFFFLFRTIASGYQEKLFR